MDDDPFPSCGIRDESEHLKTAYTLSEGGSLCRSYFKSKDAVSVFTHFHVSPRTQVQFPATVFGLPGTGDAIAVAIDPEWKDHHRLHFVLVAFQVKLEEQASCM